MANTNKIKSNQEPEFCEGFQFRYFIADTLGRKRESTPNKDFIAAEERILKRVTEFLEGRPDLLEVLSCLEGGIEIHLHHGHGFSDYKKQVYFYGRATLDGDQYTLELATDEVLSGGQGKHDVLDVVIHEFIHILDFMDDDDKEGVLPGWSKQEIKTFTKLRAQAQVKIEEHQSPLDPYALRDNSEFLAVLGETFFVKPKELQEAHPGLYTMLADYFKTTP